MKMLRGVGGGSPVAASKRTLHYCSVKGRRDEVGQLVVVGQVYEAGEVALTCHHQNHACPYRGVGKDCG